MIEQILVPLDGSALAESVLPHVLALAQPFEAEVVLLRVVESPRGEGRSQTVDPLGWQMRKAEAESYLETTAARLKEFGLEVRKELKEGKAAERIVAYAREHDVDLLILSSHGRSGLSEWNINSVVQKVILRVYLPTLIVRAYRQPEQSEELKALHYERLLAPLDGSRRAETVLPLARSIADYHDARLLLSHIVSKPEVPRRAPLTEREQELVEELTNRNREHGEAYLADLCEHLPTWAEPRLLVAEDPAAALHQIIQEEEIDMVLLSAHGYSGRAQWPYGSIALNFIAYGTTPLLIVQDLSKAEVGLTPAERAASEEKGH